jgi:hypothetical protein
VAKARREKNLYLFQVNVQKESANVAKSSNEGAMFWHQRLNHPNRASVVTLALGSRPKQGLVRV